MLKLKITCRNKVISVMTKRNGDAVCAERNYVRFKGLILLAVENCVPIAANSFL